MSRLAGGVVRVFVYGSLLSGESNHRQMAGARLVGEAVTEARFTLVDLGPYPALVAGGETAIVGEVYEVDEVLLARLDRFEGHPHLYQRTTIVLGDHGEVEVYLMGGSRPSGRPVIATGSWRAHRASR